ncbi:MAG: GNAT family N-acetyltransferase [Lachnospiraceae bacterium]|nr:GNAT family N-acetyltransferase [Lachnospiraceae bacterium]
MKIYRVTGDSPRWQRIAYDYVRTDSFCFGQKIPMVAEFEQDGPEETFEGILVTEDERPVCGLKISYPRRDVARIERVCTIREKQKSGYGRIMISEAEKWIAEKGYDHILIVSQDRAQGFYEKCGYVLNEALTPLDVWPEDRELPAKPPKHESGFVPDFKVVMVEKYLK